MIQRKLDERINEQVMLAGCQAVRESSIVISRRDESISTEEWCDNKITSTDHYVGNVIVPATTEGADNGSVTAHQWCWTDDFLNCESTSRQKDLSKNGCPIENGCNAVGGISGDQMVNKITRRRVVKIKAIDKTNGVTLKRTNQPETWKANKKRNARLRGEEYVGVGGKIVPAKVMGPACDCRMRCSDKIDEKIREELHREFWMTRDWQQRRQYIALLVNESATRHKRSTMTGPKDYRRQLTFTYSVLINGNLLTVCKPMFLSTFSVSEKLVRLAMNKKRNSPGGIISDDQRGRRVPTTKKAETVKNLVREHIKTFSTKVIRKHNSKKYFDGCISIAAMHKLYVNKCKENGIEEKDIVKESYYRAILRKELNLGFNTN